MRFESSSRIERATWYEDHSSHSHRSRFNTFVHRTTRDSSQRDDRWKGEDEIDHNDRTMEGSFAEDSSTMERSASSVSKLFVALHGVSTSHALSRRCQSERSLRSIRDDLLQEESCSDDCGNLLVDVARNSEALVIKPSDADHRITKILKARSMAYPVQFPTPITLSEMDLLVSTFDASLPSLAAIAMTTFLLGQRISDMIQLAVADLKSNDDYLTITVRRGKTMQVTTPYSLWLRRKTYPTETLIELAASAKSCGRLFLFTNLNSEEERQRVSHTVRDMLTSINDQLELRSLRRGGLQRMAHLGVSIPTMLHFSRHSDVPMLMRYLSWGQHATHLQNQMIEVVDMTTKEMNTSERIRSEATSMML
jgi:integrase